jgi:YD repeat-containing protein
LIHIQEKFVFHNVNGSQTTRVIGSDTLTLLYDAENRLVEVKKNSVSMATFVYDGDGRRVKSVVSGTTTYFVGAHYELTGSQVTKYYGVYPELVEGPERLALPCADTPSPNP